MEYIIVLLILLVFDNEYTTALDIALGQAQTKYSSWKMKIRLKKCIEHLKKIKIKGRVTFLPLNNIKAKVISSDVYSTLVKEEGFINIAENLVSVEPNYKNIVSHLLGLVIIVE